MLLLRLFAITALELLLPRHIREDVTALQLLSFQSCPEAVVSVHLDGVEYHADSVLGLFFSELQSLVLREELLKLAHDLEVVLLLLVESLGALFKLSGQLVDLTLKL